MNKIVLSSIVLALVMVAIATTAIPVLAKKSDLYEQGFAKGVVLADKDFKAVGPETNHVKASDLDCDSDVDPQESNPDFCNGVNDGYAHEANMLSGK